MIAHMSYVMCDECGNPGPMGDNAIEARELAVRDGFWRIGVVARDLCAVCAATRAAALPGSEQRG